MNEAVTKKLGRLEKISISGFKSIRSVELELRKLNVIIGANGAGKSNFLSFFRFLNKLAQEDLQLYVAQQGGADRLLHFGAKSSQELRCLLSFPSHSYSFLMTPSVGDRLIFADEFCVSEGAAFALDFGDGLNANLRRGAFESGLLQLARQLAGKHELNVAQSVIRYLLEWRVYHFHDTSATAKVKLTGKVDDRSFLRQDGENLAAYLRGISSTREYRMIIETIQRVAPFFHDFVLEPESQNKSTIRLKWRHRGSDAYFDASDLSDGTLRFMLLATLFLQPNPPTAIVIDEPELGLHPYALHILAGMMRSAASKIQIIAATQSVTLANQFDFDDIVVVDRVDEASQFRRLKEAEVKSWIGEYAMGDLWEKNLIGGTPK